MSKFNPLFPNRSTKETVSNTSEKTMTANDVEIDASFGTSAPLSPSTGRPMIFAHARDVPVWFCPDSRLVLPCRKE